MSPALAGGFLNQQTTRGVLWICLNSTHGLARETLRRSRGPYEKFSISCFNSDHYLQKQYKHILSHLDSAFQTLMCLGIT